LDGAVGRYELLDRTKTPATKFAGDRVRSCRIRIDDSHQPHRQTLLGKLMVNASMVAAERSHTDNGDVDEVVSGQASFSTGWLPADL
jgi:hypothetical protein